MPIICFEGASAIGKSTVSNFLRDNFGARVIREVNLLFERKPDEPQFWYFERQIERWQMATAAAQKFETVILDGDPFQPLWYNWAYDYDFGDPFEAIGGFYRKAILSGEIAFPDKYFIFTVPENELRQRKVRDASRTRKNFERHLRFIKPQIAYFNFLKSLKKNLVEFVENREVEDSARKIISSISPASTNMQSSPEIFDLAKDWLETRKAGEFISPP